LHGWLCHKCCPDAEGFARRRAPTHN
jgi:hypothetical protein